MNKLYIPNAHAKNLYAIDPVWFKSHGFEVIFLDLDNTLDSYRCEVATSRAKEYINRLKELDLTPIIISNNTYRRVKKYADSVGVRFVNSIGKPFVSKFDKYLDMNGINRKTAILIGDQTVTDIPFGNKARIFTILTDKLVKEDQITTRFNRLFDIPTRKRLKKLNLLVEWEDL